MHGGDAVTMGKRLPEQRGVEFLPQPPSKPARSIEGLGFECSLFGESTKLRTDRYLVGKRG